MGVLYRRASARPPTPCPLGRTGGSCSADPPRDSISVKELAPKQCQTVRKRGDLWGSPGTDWSNWMHRGISGRDQDSDLLFIRTRMELARSRDRLLWAWVQSSCFLLRVLGNSHLVTRGLGQPFPRIGRFCHPQAASPSRRHQRFTVLGRGRTSPHPHGPLRIPGPSVPMWGECRMRA
jgi:hypothetical protein